MAAICVQGAASLGKASRKIEIPEGDLEDELEYNRGATNTKPSRAWHRCSCSSPAKKSECSAIRKCDISLKVWRCSGWILTSSVEKNVNKPLEEPPFLHVHAVVLHVLPPLFDRCVSHDPFERFRKGKLGSETNTEMVLRS